MKEFRIIGDVHGKLRRYIEIASVVDYSLQIGDLGFDYAPINVLNPENHRVLGGNHDNYEVDPESGEFVVQTKHFLGDFGVHVVPGVCEFFYVRGGNSIDRKYRTFGLDWWPQEELNSRQANEALEKYKEIKPAFIVTHECPVSVIDFVSTMPPDAGILPSFTAKLLEAMLDYHRPKLWIFGHHHKFTDITIQETRFICLPELGYIDIPENFSDFSMDFRNKSVYKGW